MAELVNQTSALCPYGTVQQRGNKEIRAKTKNSRLNLSRTLQTDTVSLYSVGEFTDLCRGPHLPNTSFIKAFKLLRVAGAYWRGDEKKDVLQRIYGTAFYDAKDLKKHLNALEEAKKRDHRRLGKELSSSPPMTRSVRASFSGSPKVHSSVDLLKITGKTSITATTTSCSTPRTSPGRICGRHPAISISTARTCTPGWTSMRCSISSNR